MLRISSRTIFIPSHALSATLFLKHQTSRSPLINLPSRQMSDELAPPSPTVPKSSVPMSAYNLQELRHELQHAAKAGDTNSSIRVLGTIYSNLNLPFVTKFFMFTKYLEMHYKPIANGNKILSFSWRKESIQIHLDDENIHVLDQLYASMVQEYVEHDCEYYRNSFAKYVTDFYLNLRLPAQGEECSLSDIDNVVFILEQAYRQEIGMYHMIPQIIDATTLLRICKVVYDLQLTSKTDDSLDIEFVKEMSSKSAQLALAIVSSNDMFVDLNNSNHISEMNELFKCVIALCVWDLDVACETFEYAVQYYDGLYERNLVTQHFVERIREELSNCMKALEEEFERTHDLGIQTNQAEVKQFREFCTNIESKFSE